MAIAFVAAGARLKADVFTSGSPQSVSLPAGHLSGHLLLLVVVTDDNSGPNTPSGWTKLLETSPGTSTSTPYQGFSRVNVFWRIDTGSLGSSVSVSFNTSNWPTGDPYVLAFTAAYSGCDTVNPIGEWNSSTTTSTTLAQAHPQLSLALANCWLLTLRACDSVNTFTVSGGTNAERVDDNHGSSGAPSVALYDSNSALGTGLQTQRTTTASTSIEWGSVMASIAIRPAPVATGVVALPGVAAVTAVANAATAVTVINPWDLCGAGGLPDYRLAVDWDADGSLDYVGEILNPNPYLRSDLSDWTAVNATQVRSEEFIYPTLKLTTGAGSDPRSESGQQPVTAGLFYRTLGWVYAPVAVPGTVCVAIRWYDASHVFISMMSDSATVIVPGEWNVYDQAVPAPGGAAYASVTMVVLGTPGAGYVLHGTGLHLIDPNQDDVQLMAMGPGEDVTDYELDVVNTSYGRDQNRQLSPGTVGSASLRLCNANRLYSPENGSSPLFGDLNPARDARFQVTWAGEVFPLFRGKIDDYQIQAEFSDRSASFSFLDGLSLLQGIKLSTEVHQSKRTGELIDAILDEVGWTAGRNIDFGATMVKYWWAEGTDALSAVQDLVRSEGPPSVAFVGPDGSFNFHDRHHRLQNQRSLEVQGEFTAAAIGCDSPAATGLSIGQPFTYEHGWRDIVNSVTFEVDERTANIAPSEVWSSDDTYSLSIGQSMEIDISVSDPFLDAVTPVSGTDYTLTGSGVLSITLDKTSGQAVKMTLLAVGGSIVVSNLRLRARSIPVQRTVKITRVDSTSIMEHGQRDFPDTAPWANSNDAAAIADMILLHYSERRPTVQLRVHTQDPTHFVQVLRRTISDRIHIQNDELGLNDDFFVERVSHTIERINRAGAPPVHSVILGCEKHLVVVANPFTFDKRGAGFDEGVFDPIQADDPDTVFTFDHPTLGKFDFNRFGT